VLTDFLLSLLFRSICLPLKSLNNSLLPNHHSATILFQGVIRHRGRRGALLRH
ncbi:hypothetical protein AMECASPLE_035964, partial [Ameca splendens]